MERPATFANLWLILKTVGFILALEGISDYYTNRHAYNSFRKLVLAYYWYVHGLEHDPSQPRLPENWEEWYNS